MGGFKMSELLVILAIALLFFGGSRVANLGGSLGQAIRNFKRGLSGDDAQAKPDTAEAAAAPTNAALASANGVEAKAAENAAQPAAQKS